MKHFVCPFLGCFLNCRCACGWTVLKAMQHVCVQFNNYSMNAGIQTKYT